VKNTVHLKIHEMQDKQFLSCCDSDLLGKTFTEGKTCLRVTESFYKGTEITLEEASIIIRDNIKAMDSVHIIGERIIDYLHEKDVICKDGVRRVNKIPHLIIIHM